MQEEFKRNYEEYLPHKQKTSQSQSSSKRKVSIYKFFFFFSMFWKSSSLETMTVMTRRAHHQALMKRNSWMNSIATFLLAVSMGVDDPIKWWHDNQGSYPRLSRMARDYLTIPGQSVLGVFSFFLVNSQFYYFIFNFSCIGFCWTGF